MPPKEKTVLTAYEQFLEKGIVGAVAVLAIAALIWAIVKLLQSKDERIKDQSLFADAMKKTNEAVAALTVEVNKTATAGLAEACRTSTALGTSVQNLERSLRDVEGKLGQLRDEQVRLVASLNNGGPVRVRR